MAIAARKVVPPSAASARYELGPVLGVGGMGTIHRAYDRVTRQTVAYKRLKLRDEAMRARVTALFQREYDTLARLKHPNVISAYDYGFDAEGPYYTMELLSGVDLKRVGKLSVREVCRIVRSVALQRVLGPARLVLRASRLSRDLRVGSGEAECSCRHAASRRSLRASWTRRAFCAASPLERAAGAGETAAAARAT
ncbi:MAG TPA: protein kinase [Polyangiales bacterium]|nr:protein kinase [Polyangiales bacterium]